MPSFYGRQLFLLLTIMASSGCHATIELIKAPFDATSAIADGTTQASSELTQPTQEFTSSTTPGSLFKNEQRLRKFLAHNFDNLRQDIAQGRGEYISSMAILADIPLARHRQLFAELQNRYPFLYSQEIVQAEFSQRLLDTVALNVSSGLRNNATR